jgi:hypothetical protein
LRGLVAISFKAVQAGRGRSPALVAQNGLPPMHPGWSRFSLRPYKQAIFALAKIAYGNCGKIA